MLKQSLAVFSICSLLHRRRADVDNTRARRRFYKEGKPCRAVEHIRIRQGHTHARPRGRFVYHNKERTVRLFCENNRTLNGIILVADAVAGRTKTNLHPRGRALEFVGNSFIRRIIQRAQGNRPVLITLLTKVVFHTAVELTALCCLYNRTVRANRLHFRNIPCRVFRTFIRIGRRADVEVSTLRSFHKEGEPCRAVNHIRVRQGHIHRAARRLFVNRYLKRAVAVVGKYNRTLNRFVLVTNPVARRSKTNLHPGVRALEFIRYRLICRIVEGFQATN